MIFVFLPKSSWKSMQEIQRKSIETTVTKKGNRDEKHNKHEGKRHLQGETCNWHEKDPHKF